MAAEFLAARGATVRTAASAEEGYRLLVAGPPDVLVSDLGMPREDGLGFIRRVRNLTPEAGGDVRALAVTGCASREDARRAIAAGFQAHLAKPLQLDEFVEALARLRPRPSGANP